MKRGLLSLVVLVTLLAGFFYVSPSDVGAQELIKKVPIDKQPTDPEVLKALTVAGIDKEYVELTKDYSLQSPYSRTYADRKSNYQFLEVSQLPMVDAEGDKLKVGWFLSNGRYYTNSPDKSYNNLFWGEVVGTQVTLIVMNDQPTGIRAGDQVRYDPQLFIGGIEIRAPLELMLSGNEYYNDNVLAWDYGICERQIRTVEGMYRERWIFAEAPKGEIRIVHNQTGDYRLKLGQYAIDNDIEVVPIKVLDKVEYPLIISASSTFYPEPGSGTAGVDGWAQETADGNWATIVADGGAVGNDDQENLAVVFAAFTTAGVWNYQNRTIVLLDSSALPPDCVITAATLSVYGKLKVDDLSCLPDINVYASAPALTTAIAAGDYDCIGTTPFSSAIAYGDFNVGTPGTVNDFVLNEAGRNAISKTSISKFGLRNANYDVAEELDSGTPDPNWVNSQASGFLPWSSDKGAGYKPKLVVTYTEAPPIPTWTPAPPPEVPRPPSGTERLSLLMAGCVVLFFSELGFWRRNPLLFMLAAGASIMLGLYWYDVYTTNIGLTISLMLIAYSLVCLGFAFGCIFWRDRLRDEE